MKKSGLPVIILCLLAIIVILSLGTVTQGKQVDVAIVQVDRSQKEILVTPSGKQDILILPEILNIKRVKIGAFKVGEQIRDDFPVIYVDHDFNKIMRITFNSLWGEKIYVVKLILSEYIQFVIDGEVTHIASKEAVAAMQGFPQGNYTWYMDQELTKEFNLATLIRENKLFLYTSTR